MTNRGVRTIVNKRVTRNRRDRYKAERKTKYQPAPDLVDISF